MKGWLTVICVCICALWAIPTQATVWHWNNIPIDGLQETPPVATPGTGLGTASLNTVTKIMMISGSYSGLTGTANNAHLHGPAPPGTPAGVIFGLSFTASTAGTFNGTSGVLPAATITNILNGLSYINIHSTFKTGGEIRGQLQNPIQIPEPTGVLLLSVGASSLFAFGRRRRFST